MSHNLSFCDRALFCSSFAAHTPAGFPKVGMRVIEIVRAAQEMQAVLGERFAVPISTEYCQSSYLSGGVLRASTILQF